MVEDDDGWGMGKCINGEDVCGVWCVSSTPSIYYKI
jgi:hypothetical protein